MVGVADTPLERTDCLLLPVGGHRRTPRVYALIDAVDASMLDWKWSLSVKGYVIRHNKADRRMVLLHRVILGLTPGTSTRAAEVVDHINGDRLDNRRANLRVGSWALNGQNILRTNGSSQYRGVAWHRGAQKWEAYCELNGRKHYLGLFDDELAAARVAAEFRQETMPWTNEGRIVGSERVHKVKLGI